MPPIRRMARRARRSRSLYWALSVALALASAAIVHRAASGAAAAQQRWGALHTVAIATRELPSGTVLGPGDVTLEQRPGALVPADALTTDPSGATVAARIAAGEPVLRSRLAPAGLGPIAARLPPGRTGVALPRDGAPPLAVGDAVDVIGVGLLSGAAQILVRAAAVVDAGADEVTVAVPDGVVAAVAAARLEGSVVLALSASPPAA